MKAYDVVIIGGGPGGSRAAEILAQAGKKVCIVEKDQIGGTCLNQGCIPLKTMLHTVKIREQLIDGLKTGRFTGKAPEICLEKLAEEKDGILNDLRKGLIGRLKNMSVDIFYAYGSLVRKDMEGKFITAAGHQELQSAYLILASGSVPRRLYANRGIPAASDYVLACRELPASIVVIGAGVIGLETAAFFHALAPDLVVSDYASNYSSMLADVKNMQNIRSTITEGKYFITYCEYLKDSLLIQEFGKKPDDIVAIPHAVNNMMDEILLSDHYLTGCMNSSLFQRHARAILGTVVSNADQTDYIGKGFYGFSFQDVKYIFYASQLRGSKNILNLVRAYHKLLRKNHVQVKLFLTCRLYEGADVTAYIREHNLQYDVLSFWGVSQQQLASLYACAELVVNPTFYEGGFPFTFGEGMSVGTPSIMGKIPQIMDVAQGYSLEKYMFDPYNIEDMVEKISYALSHTEEVYQAEKVLYEELDKRSWGDVGEEYVKAFEMFLSRK